MTIIIVTYARTRRRMAINTVHIRTKITSTYVVTYQQITANT